MTDLEEYFYYDMTLVAKQLFMDIRFMINPFGDMLELELEGQTEDDLYGSTTFPDKIIIYIGNIYKNANYGRYYNFKFEYKYIYDIAASNLLITMVHELFHTVHNFNLADYTANQEYKKEIEDIIEAKTYEFITKYHNRLCGILHIDHVIFPHTVIIDMSRVSRFVPIMNITELVKCTVSNCIIRDTRENLSTHKEIYDKIDNEMNVDIRFEIEGHRDIQFPIKRQYVFSRDMVSYFLYNTGISFPSYCQYDLLCKIFKKPDGPYILIFKQQNATMYPMNFLTT